MPLAETLEPTIDAPGRRTRLPRNAGWLVATAASVIALTLAVGILTRSKTPPPVAPAARPTETATAVTSAVRPAPVVPSASAAASPSASAANDLEILDAGRPATASSAETPSTAASTWKPKPHKATTAASPSAGGPPKPRINDGF